VYFVAKANYINGIFMQKEAAGSKPNIDILKGFFGIGVQYN
jgi:hypothetical protein